MDGAPEQAAHPLRPVLAAEAGPVLEFAENVGGAEGLHGSGDGETRPPAVVRGNAGQSCITSPQPARTRKWLNGRVRLRSKTDMPQPARTRKWLRRCRYPPRG